MGTNVVIVTGASQGIGSAIVAGYRKAGWNVVATSRNIEPSTDPQIATVRGDIASPPAASAVVATAIERFGRIDSLVNNAGVFVSKPFVDYTPADYDLVTGVNLGGFFRLTQLVAARMLAEGHGHIVNVTAALAAQPQAAIPAALASLTKGGLDAITTGLAMEFAGRGVRVNAVAPGIIATPMHAPATHEYLGKLHPLGRMGGVDDIVGAVLYLESAAFVTGVILPVDGGMSAGIGA